MKRRDGHCCKICGATDNGKSYPDHNLEAHHIYRWHDCPRLRFSVGNGITLCRSCHGAVTGRESYVAPFLLRLIARKR